MLPLEFISKTANCAYARHHIYPVASIITYNLKKVFHYHLRPNLKKGCYVILVRFWYCDVYSVVNIESSGVPGKTLRRFIYEVIDELYFMISLCYAKPLNVLCNVSIAIIRGTYPELGSVLFNKTCNQAKTNLLCKSIPLPLCKSIASYKQFCVIPRYRNN